MPRFQIRLTACVYVYVCVWSPPEAMSMPNETLVIPRARGAIDWELYVCVWAALF